MNKKTLILTSAATVIIGSALLTTSIVNAQDSSGYSSIVQKLSEKFNLNKDDVQKVFDEERTARQAEMYAMFEDRLSSLVKDGKITDAQKKALLDKHAQIQEQLEQLKDLSEQERKDEVKKIHDDFGVWLKDQGIDIKDIGFFGFGRGFVRGFRMGYKFHN